MLRIPVSGLAITEAASRNVALGVADAGAAAAAGAPGVAGAVVDATGAAAAAGSTLSVSRRISLMFATSVSQNLLADTELMVAVELFCAAVAACPPGCAPLTCVDTVAMLRMSRARFT